MTAAMAASLHDDVASAIGQQVEQMIMQAKKDSEVRVSHDLQLARAQLQKMETMITDLGARVQHCARRGDPSLTVDRTFLTQRIQMLELKWGEEVKALKQDLHRTILAHNHNSDLMRHHRDALDEARRKLDMQAPLTEHVDAQIDKADRLLQQSQAKQRALTALTERLGSLEMQMDELPVVHMPTPFSGLPMGMSGMGGVPPMMGGSTAGGLDASSQQAVPARSGGTISGGGSFNLEAPVFVPGGAQATPTPAPVPVPVPAAAPVPAPAPAVTPATPAPVQSAPAKDVEGSDTEAAAAPTGAGDEAAVEAEAGAASAAGGTEAVDTTAAAGAEGAAAQANDA